MVTDTAPHTTPETLNSEDKKAFFDKAQETAANALNATVEAVKAHPGIAAAAVAGTAAAVAGAAYGVSKLTGDSTDSKSTAKK